MKYFTALQYFPGLQVTGHIPSSSIHLKHRLYTLHHYNVFLRVPIIK